MKILIITRKFLLEIMREWQLVIMILLLPVVFLLITYFTYPGQIIQTYPIHISVLPQHSEQTDSIIASFEKAKYANGLAVFTVNQDSLSESIVTEKVHAHEIVLDIQLDTTKEPLTITILGDPLYQGYYQAINQLDPRWLGDNPIQWIESSITPLYVSGPQTNFELFAPGMIIFAILLLTMQTAMLITREIKTGTIRRFQLSGTKSFAIISGITLAQMVIVVLQLLVIGWISIALGFRIQGSLWLAFLIANLLALSAIGQGLILGCYLENDTQAATLGATAAMVQVFVSGAFFEMPSFPVFHLGSHAFNLFDVFPATSSMQLFSMTLSYNAPFAYLQYRLTLLIVLTLLTFAAAVIIFQCKQLQA
jgi:ABC-2 type transport system permease protein